MGTHLSHLSVPSVCPRPSWDLDLKGLTAPPFWGTEGHFTPRLPLQNRELYMFRDHTNKAIQAPATNPRPISAWAQPAPGGPRACRHIAPARSPVPDGYLCLVIKLHPRRTPHTNSSFPAPCDHYFDGTPSAPHAGDWR